MDRMQDRRRRMIEAARVLMLRDGLRATTMEAIAREAGVAKATLYAQFPDKNAVFAAIVELLLARIGGAFAAGMAGPGTVAEQVGAALAGQYAALADALEGSPHAAELMSEHKRNALALPDVEQGFGAEIAAALAQAGVGQADELARLVGAAAYGIALKTRDRATMEASIRLLCRRLIEPEIRIGS